MNPYNNQTSDSEKHIHETLKNHKIVCAIKYENDRKIRYELRQFSSKTEAVKAGFIVTHQGVCGTCSNLRDLAVYLKKNLVGPVRRCGFIGIISANWARKCLREIGFTEQCVDIWLYDAMNTWKRCFCVCLWDWITGKPYSNPDGSLNACLQCDEDNSGPVFKFFAGRIRRNSGIHSEIKRPKEQIYNMTHCYF